MAYQKSTTSSDSMQILCNDVERIFVCKDVENGLVRSNLLLGKVKILMSSSLIKEIFNYDQNS